jgi:hypothetical protein
VNVFKKPCGPNSHEKPAFDSAILSIPEVLPGRGMAVDGKAEIVVKWRAR